MSINTHPGFLHDDKHEPVNRSRASAPILISYERCVPPIDNSWRPCLGIDTSNIFFEAEVGEFWNCCGTSFEQIQNYTSESPNASFSNMEKWSCVAQPRIESSETAWSPIGSTKSACAATQSNRCGQSLTKRLPSVIDTCGNCLELPLRGRYPWQKKHQHLTPFTTLSMISPRKH